MPSGRRHRTDVRAQHGTGDGTTKHHYQRRSIDTSGEKSFSDGLLTLPGYRFEKCISFGDPGTPRLLAEGVKLHGRIEVGVIAKIGPMKGISGIEREAHILHALSKSHEGRTRIFQLMEVVEIPPAEGGVRVLILKHPGRNILTEYFHSNIRSTFLLPGLVREKLDGESQDAEVGQDNSQVIPTAGNLYPQHVYSPKRTLDSAPKDMDLSTFLHFAIQATQCLEVLHNSYGTHGDIRPQAFHWQSDDVIRFAHFGQRTTYVT